MRNKTKIVATMWPAIEKERDIIKVFKAGVQVIRFNFSHAKYDSTLKTVNIINKLNKEKITNLSYLLDTKWPEIRVWEITWEFEYKKWESFKIYANNKSLTKKDIWIDYPHIVNDLKKWKSIIIDSGTLKVKVTEKTKEYLVVKTLNSWKISTRRHVNLPGINLKFDWLSQKDKDDILFAVKNNFHFIAASFVRSAEDVIEIRKLLEKNWGQTIKIISKIENQEGIDNLDEIIMVSDGIMVARGDLWIEVPVEKLWKHQKEMVEKCREKWKFVIVATHFLESMIYSPFPTRAETSDIFNATRWQPDSLMLSWETAVGKYPILSIKMMSKVIKEAEKTITYKYKDFSDDGLRVTDIEKKYMIKSWLFLWEQLKAKAILVFTKTWLLARLASTYKPKLPVYAFTKFESTEKYANILYNTTAFHLTSWDQNNFAQNLDDAIKFLLKEKILTKNDTIIVINDIQKSKKEIPVLEIINLWDFLSI